MSYYRGGTNPGRTPGATQQFIDRVETLQRTFGCSVDAAVIAASLQNIAYAGRDIAQRLEEAAIAGRAYDQ